MSTSQAQKKLHAQVRKILRSGDTDAFDTLVDSIGDEQIGTFINAPACPTALQLAVISNSTELVKRVLELLNPEYIDYKPDLSGKNVLMSTNNDELALCENKTAREVAEQLISVASPGDKVRYAYIKSTLIRAGATPKRGLFGLSRNNAEDVAYFKKWGSIYQPQQTKRGAGRRSNKTRRNRRS
jgi:hypothetical protein